MVTAPVIKSGSDQFQLPSKFYVRSEGLGRRMEVTEMPFSDVAIDVADGGFKPRSIEVTGVVVAADESAANSALDSLLAFAHRDDLTLHYRNRFIRVGRLKEVTISDEDRGGGFIYHIAFSFTCPDPVWYDSTETTESDNTGGVSPFELDFENAGTAPCHPVITVTLAASGEKITIAHSEDGREFVFSKSGLQSGDVLQVDCYAGAVKLNGQNAIQQFTGQFLRVLPGDNTLIYTGPSAQISVKFRKAYV